MLRVYNNTARYVDQGGNKVGQGPVVTCCRFLAPQIPQQRDVFSCDDLQPCLILDTVCVSVCVTLLMSQRPGAFAIYLEPWHPDVFDFLDLRKNHGSEEKVFTSLHSLPSKLGLASFLFSFSGVVCVDTDMLIQNAEERVGAKSQVVYSFVIVCYTIQ